MTRLVFSEDGHRYSLDGERVPSVSTVKSKAIAKPALVGWAARLAAEWAAVNLDSLPVLGEEAWIKQAAGASKRSNVVAIERGKQLHTIAEALVYGSPMPECDADGQLYPDDVVRMARQLASFFDAWQVAPLLHESFVFHELHRWAGRLDLIAELDGERWLLDYKTGASGIWPETSLQLAAYRHATHIVVDGDDRPMPHVEHAAAVWIRADSWELVPVRADAATYGVFCSALPVAAWVSQRREESVGAPIPLPAHLASSS